MKCKLIAAFSAAVFPLTGAMLFAEKAMKAEASPASAYWEGVEASGAVVKGNDCPVVVEKETLDLKISTLPHNGKVEHEKYAAAVTAEYSFYNPTDSKVDMSLLFPFGVFPSYFMPDGLDDKVSAVTVDGESAECRMRYTYVNAPYGFEIDKDIERVQDEKKQDSFYSADMPVKEYRLSLAVPEGKDVTPLLKIKLDFNPQKTRVLFPSESETRLSISGGDMYASSYLREAREQTFVFYAVGEAFFSMAAKLYSNDKEILSVDSPVAAETTFSEFALSKRSNTSQVGDIDWYNAFVDMLVERGGKDGSVDGFELEEKNPMHWFEYQMSIPACWRAVNRVCAPLYPTVDGSRNPRYKYSYLLSPAGKWADFKEIEIKIDTPYYLSNGSLDFTRTDREDGKGFTYSYSRSSLPQGELTFVLTEKDAVESDFSVFGKDFLLPPFTWAFIALLVLSAVAAVVTVIVVVSLRKKKK